MNKELIINTYELDTLLFKENLLGTFKNNILKYENENDSFIIDLANKTFYKENLESILILTATHAVLTLKELNKSFQINLKKHNFKVKENLITIEYCLESMDKPLKITIEMSDTNEI